MLAAGSQCRRWDAHHVISAYVDSGSALLDATDVAIALQTRRIAQSPLLDLALLGLYAAAMWHCWQEGIVQQVVSAVQASVPAPDLASLSALCKTSAFSSLCWIHLLMLDLFMARWVAECTSARASCALHEVTCLVLHVLHADCADVGGPTSCAQITR